jgi:hypothetical protein
MKLKYSKKEDGLKTPIVLPFSLISLFISSSNCATISMYALAPFARNWKGLDGSCLSLLRSDLSDENRYKLSTSGEKIRDEGLKRCSMIFSDNIVSDNFMASDALVTKVFETIHPKQK